MNVLWLRATSRFCVELRNALISMAIRLIDAVTLIIKMLTFEVKFARWRHLYRLKIDQSHRCVINLSWIWNSFILDYLWNMHLYVTCAILDIMNNSSAWRLVDIRYKRSDETISKLVSQLKLKRSHNCVMSCKVIEIQFFVCFLFITHHCFYYSCAIITHDRYFSKTYFHFQKTNSQKLPPISIKHHEQKLQTTSKQVCN